MPRNVKPDREGRMFAVVQFPMLDTGGLLRDAYPRLSRPTWPDPHPGVEFVRSVGGVVSRPLGPVPGWDGEMAFCRAERLVRMDSDPGHGPSAMHLQYRRLFGSEDGYRLDIGFVVRSGAADPAHVLENLRSLRVRVPGGVATDLFDSGPAIAARLGSLTSNDSSVNQDRIVAGRPAALIEHSAVAGDPLLRRLRTRNDERLQEVATFELIGTRTQRSRLRAVRGALWRLHAELEVLRLIGRLARRSEDRVDEVALIAALRRMTRPLARNYRYGFSQPPLVALATGPSDLQDLLVLAEAVRKDSLEITRRLQLLAQRALLEAAGKSGVQVQMAVRIDQAGEVVMGDSIRASEGSIVNSKSAIINSTNSVEGGLDPQLSEVLVTVMRLAEESGVPEAVELTDAMSSAAKSGNRAVFSALWARLREVAPVVGSAAGVGTVFQRFLSS